MESKQELNSSKSSKDSFTVDETLLEEELSVKPHIPPQIFMPPPAPLQPKDALPCEPIHTGFQIPFVRLPKFEGTEQLWDQAPEITQEERRAADCHAPELTLRSLFEFDTNIVYRRKQMSKLNQSADFYNANLCNVRKLVKGKKRKNTTLHDNLEPYYTKTSAADNTLIFESRFETGNLEKAVKIQSNEYNLLLQNDINSKGHTQWFFFRVQNTRKNASIKFNIVNFVKKDSLYNHGMKILIYSEKLAELTGEGWFRGGEDIKYFANGMKRQDRVVYKSYHTLTFKYKFQFTGDTIYFANSFPYTYTQLQDYLTEIQEDPEKSPFCNVKPLWRTLASNRWDTVIITSPDQQREGKQKRGVVLSARTHPGETVGSWMMQGVLEFMSGNSEEAIFLREKYVFKIIPMINIDGVVNGNYRCSMVGADLNRRWRAPLQFVHPVIFNFKNLIREFKQDTKIDLIADLHGHSRRHNIFAYGCNISSQPHLCKLYPYTLSKISNFFDYNYSRFKVQKSKGSTLRVSLFRDLKIPFVYTIESSFWGMNKGIHSGKHFTRQHLKDMGRDLCLALIINTNVELPRELSATPALDLRSKTTQEKGVQYMPPESFSLLLGFQENALLSEFMANDELVHAGEEEESSSGSDSDPSDDNLEVSELKQILPSMTNMVGKTSRKMIRKKTVIRNNSSRKKLIRHNSQPEKKLPDPPKIDQTKTVDDEDKKCKICKEPLVPGHLWRRKKTLSRTVTAPQLKIYYNKSGRRVEDKAWQTPAHFYPKAFVERNLKPPMTASATSLRPPRGGTLRNSTTSYRNPFDLDKLVLISNNVNNSQQGKTFSGSMSPNARNSQQHTLKDSRHTNGTLSATRLRTLVNKNRNIIL